MTIYKTKYPDVFKFHEFDTINTSGYPRYNIVQTEKNVVEIQIALAGFSDEQIEITQENKHLIISGTTPKSETDDDYPKYFHKGIATRDFSLKFKLHENAQINGAKFTNGLLNIELEMVVQEKDKPKKIEIQKD